MHNDTGPLESLRRLNRLVFWPANALSCVLLALVADDQASQIAWLVVAIVTACFAYACRSSWMPRRAMRM